MAEIFHQSFQVLHDGREHGLLVHVGHASIGSPPEAMGLFGLAEQMFDAVTKFSGDLVATCTRQIPGGDKRFGLSELLTPFAQVFQISASPLPDGDCGRLAQKFFKGRFVFPTIVGMRAGSILFRVNDLSPDSVAKIDGALR